jgi:hypothetical protein
MLINVSLKTSLELTLTRFRKSAVGWFEYQ